MVQKGASLKEVADVLGLRSLDTTAIYAKLDLPTLREVALPLPAQPRDPMRGDIVEEAFRNSEAPEVLEAVQQPVGVGGIVAAGPDAATGITGPQHRAGAVTWI